MRNVAVVSIILIVVVSAFALDAQVAIFPAAAVEVGEEVLFDAMATTHADAAQLARARFEWDFGDGYVLKFGSPYSSSANSGIATVHYFMRPGTFTVKLKVSIYTYGGDAVAIEPPLEVDSVVKTVTVTGVAPPAGFELLHAPFSARIAQYVTASVPQSLSAARLVVTLSGPGSFSQVLLDKTAPSMSERFLLDHRTLGKGDYVMNAELRAGNGTVIGTLREKWNKPFDGIAKAGIDENNAFCIDGKPFFPVTPWMKNKEDLKAWSDSGYINTTYQTGWYATQDQTTWLDYLNQSSAARLRVIGPTRWQGQAPTHFGRNHDIRKMSEYVTSTYTHPALLMWSWGDEPNMGGRHQKIPPSVMAAWSFTCHRNDPFHHPVAVNLYGYDYLPYYGANGSQFDYVNSASEFGGKKAFYVDATGFDIYPIEYHRHASLNDPNRGVMDLYAEAIDNLVKRNLDLIPAMSFVEVCDVEAARPSAPPTSAQVLMESWINVVHGVKGINWFNFFVYSTIRYDAMKKFCSQVTRLAPAILSAPSAYTITDNANARGNRVDFMAREHGDTLYLFSVRVTEPDSEWIEVPEPQRITATFTLSGVPAVGPAVVIDESRTVAIASGSFSDDFEREAVHIYAIPLQKASVAISSGRALAKHCEVRIHNDVLSVQIPGIGKSTVELFDMKGRCLARWVNAESEAVAECVVPLANRAGGPAVLRVRRGSTVWTRTLFQR